MFEQLATAQVMTLPFRKDLDKYKDLDEDEILGKLSEEELKQLETVLDDLDPEVGINQKKFDIYFFSFIQKLVWNKLIFFLLEQYTFGQRFFFPSLLMILLTDKQLKL